MGILVSLIFSLLPFAVLGGLIMAIVASRRKSDEASEEEPDAGIGTVRRLFLYGITFIALVFSGVGLSLLLGGALNAAAGDLVVSTSDSELAVALAFTVVGVPAWLVFALLAQRTVTREPAERRSQLRRAYFAAARAVALCIVIAQAIEVARYIARLEDFDGDSWGWLLTWAAIWMLHTRLPSAEAAPTNATRLVDRLYVYFASIVGLYVFGAGAIFTLLSPLAAAYDALFRDLLVPVSWSEDLREGLTVALVGLAVWAWHWLRLLARGDSRTTLWYTHLFLAGIAPGLAIAVGSLTVVLFQALQWWFGDPHAAEAAEHFSSLPSALAPLLVGGLSWGYHRAVLREEVGEASRWSEPERIYRYLAAAAGLLTLSAGLVTLLAVSLDALPRRPELLQGQGWQRDSLVLGVTLAFVGLPLWARYWALTQHEAAEGGAAERSALPRRIYLFASFGIAALVTLVNLTIILFQLFEGILEGSLSSEFFRETRWSLALVLVAGAVSAYHWLVLRDDQAAAPAAPVALPLRRREVILVAPAGLDGLAELTTALRAVEGLSLRSWERTGDAATVTAAQVASVRDALLVAAGDRFLLVAGTGGLDLIPYRPV